MTIPKSIYIAGPMTGLPGLNFEAFNAAEVRLTKMGWHVENPASNPPPHVPPADPDDLWRYYMRLSLGQIIKCESIGFLGGWENSRGALFELYVAQRLNMKVHFVYPGEPDDSDVLSEFEE